MNVNIKNGYWRSIASVLTGSVVAQIIPVLGTLILARICSPSEFGLYASWLGVVLFISVIITGRFETSLAIEEDGDSRKFSFVSTLITSCTVSLFLLILLSVVAASYPAISEKIALSLSLWAIPTALTIAVVQTWQSWAAAEGAYRKLSIIRITNASAIILSQLAFSFFQLSGATMLAFGYFSGGLITCALCAKLMPVGKLPTEYKKIEVIKAFWYRQRRFPLLSLPADAINSAATQLPIIIVASRFGAEATGSLAMTLRILGAPIGLLGKSVLDVFKRHAATHYREFGECRDIYIKNFKILLIGSLVFVFVMFFLSETLFVIAFGEQWRFSGTIVIWMLPYFALAFVASPLSYIVYISNKQYLDLFWQISLFTMTCISLIVPEQYADALKIYSGGYALLYVIYIVMSYRFSLGGKK
ncbi:oligosaccharide flippase family protein [Candidatus Williamhamiltonella defendens]|uniref:oligosaccharide flippase family protein n=1 Tax=Candidatus Williamhamiltonella defendens TaxID=138072 RepID=UPI0016511CE6|nr:oligosaccharide flippase family protein [Candidatus Hamiltonella defensa]